MPETITKPTAADATKTILEFVKSYEHSEVKDFLWSQFSAFISSTDFEALTQSERSQYARLYHDFEKLEKALRIIYT